MSHSVSEASPADDGATAQDVLSERIRALSAEAGDDVAEALCEAVRAPAEASALSVRAAWLGLALAGQAEPKRATANLLHLVSCTAGESTFDPDGFALALHDFDRVETLRLLDDEPALRDELELFRVRFIGGDSLPLEAAIRGLLRPDNEAAAPTLPARLEQAHALIDAGDVERALAVTKQYLDAEPDDPAGLLCASECADLQGDIHAALSYARSAERPSNVGRIAYEESRLLEKLGRYEEGLEAADRGMFRPGFKSGHLLFVRAKNLTGLQRHAEALRANTRCLAQYPRFIEARRDRVHISRALDDHELVEVDTSWLIHRAPAEGAHWADRALSRLALGRAGDALADAEEALRRAPDERAFRLIRAIVRVELEDWSQAEADLDWLIDSAAPRPDPQASAYRGLARARQEDWAGALEDLQLIVTPPCWVAIESPNVLKPFHTLQDVTRLMRDVAPHIVEALEWPPDGSTESHARCRSAHVEAMVGNFAAAADSLMSAIDDGPPDLRRAARQCLRQVMPYVPRDSDGSQLRRRATIYL